MQCNYLSKNPLKRLTNAQRNGAKLTRLEVVKPRVHDGFWGEQRAHYFNWGRDLAYLLWIYLLYDLYLKCRDVHLS